MQQITKHICTKTKDTLLRICDEYLIDYEKTKENNSSQKQRIRRILSAFSSYLAALNINLTSIKIVHIDNFLAEINQCLAPSTYKMHLYCIRKFMKYLYQEQGILKTDLSLLMTAPRRAQIAPPKFLQNHELQSIFNNVDLFSKRDFRSYAILHLSNEFGLLPREICMITLDDIRFGMAEINLRYRCYEFEIWFPLSEKTLKAIVLYIVKARPQSKQRALFLKLKSPYDPISPPNVCGDLSRLMHKVNLSASSYWLRHTYAKNLLEQGASPFEIKELFGYDRMQTAERYLQIHVKLMRKVLFDETL
jgi:site-specific recombinase XerD